MKENGLKDYLTLLSIYQSCRYRGISFLKVLLSRERDLDVFCKGKHRKRRTFLEALPSGFTPPYLLHRHTSKSKSESPSKMGEEVQAIAIEER
jgi:hypothetical protein